MSYKHFLLIFLLFIIILPCVKIYSEITTNNTANNSTNNISGQNNNGNYNNLLVGGLIAIISAIITAIVQHLLDMRSENIKRNYENLKREAEIRKKEKFFIKFYGYVSIMIELLEAYKTSKIKGNTKMIDKMGFQDFTTIELKEKFKKKYEEFARFFYKEREEGTEIYFPKELSDKIAEFYAYLDLYYRNIDDEEINLEKLKTLSESLIAQLEELRGIPRKS
jgi:uncharacterized metal-binding protein